jgi:hypothetical protein
MRTMIPQGRCPAKARVFAFTLAEVVISMAIVALLFNGILTAYIQSSLRTEWSGYSLAAQAQAVQSLEQAKAAVWDVLQTPVVNQLTNVPTVIPATLDLPISGTNVVWVTNYVTITNVSITSIPPVVSVYLVRVDTVWPFSWNGVTKLYTNTIACYYAPE